MDGPGQINPQQQPTNPTPPLTDAQRQEWNRFLDFTEKEGYKGSPLLDDRNKNLGLYLMQKYKTLNPKSTITYQDVPRVQSELQNYRTNLVNQWKSGKMVASPDIKSEADIMAGLSPVDSWLGSKTSSHKFPIAVATTSTGQQQNYGTNVAQFDKDRGVNK